MTGRRSGGYASPIVDAMAPWIAPLCVGALLIVVDQIIQVWVTLGPIDFSVPISRFQAAALFAGRTVAVAIAMLLTVLAAQGARHRGWLRVQGVIGILLGGLLLLTLSVLWVDGPRVKSSIPGENLTEFTAQWIRGLVVSAAGAILFSAFGVRLLGAR
jgi:hypothetical protein